jgi:hypothetical protein
MDTGGVIELGSALFTLVEPHRGHEVAYNRWYERDHFYAGCMVGPWLFAGRRWVCTADLKDRRHGTRPGLFGDERVGSYLALYWVIKGKHDEHFAWGLDQVRWLHANGRMFDERDHIHTLLYNLAWAVGRDEDGVPPELALDHPYQALVVSIVERADGVDWRQLEPWYAEHAADAPGVGQSIAFRPIPLPEGPPVPEPGLDDRRLRTVVLQFADVDPATAVDQVRARDAALAGSGLGEVLWSSAFRPTIPGTDTYTDQLW